MPYQNYRAMEVPFYLSFKEFEKNYYNNLERWFEKYHNASEIDFLKFLADMYKSYLSYNFSENKLQTDASIKVKNCFFPYFENFGISFCLDYGNGRKTKPAKEGIQNVSEWKTITMMEYSQHILDKINTYFQSNQLKKEQQNVREYINNYEIITAKEQTGYCLDYDLHQKTIPFLKAFLPIYGSTVDISLYRNFHFSVVRIAEFIDRKLVEVQAFESSIFSALKSEATMTLHMKNQNFLTICN